MSEELHVFDENGAKMVVNKNYFIVGITFVSIILLAVGFSVGYKIGLKEGQKNLVKIKDLNFAEIKGYLLDTIKLCQRDNLSASFYAQKSNAGFTQIIPQCLKAQEIINIEDIGFERDTKNISTREV